MRATCFDSFQTTSVNSARIFVEVAEIQVLASLVRRVEIDLAFVYKS